MFEKAGLIFKITYFLVSIAPAIILFSITMEFDLTIVIVEIVISIIVTILLKKFLVNVSNSSGGMSKKIDNAPVADKNGDILSLIFGIIIPSVIIPDNLSSNNKVLFFVIIQIMVYFLMIRSSSVFPNVLLILFGVNTYRLGDGTYLIDVNGTVTHRMVSVSVKRIGSSTINNTYVIKKEQHG
mgnify:CR=1 FL=1